MVNEEDKAKAKKGLFGDNNLNRNMGTRRLNRMPLLILTLIGGIVVAAIMYSYYLRSESMNSRKGDDKRPVPSSASNLLANAPLAGLIDGEKATVDDLTPPTRAPAKVTEPVVTPTIPEALQKQLDDLINKTKLPDPPQQIAPPPAPPSPPPLTDEEKQMIALENARQKALMAAILANTTIGGAGQPINASASATAPASAMTNPYSSNLADSGSSVAASTSADNNKDPNKQQEKKDFLNQKPDTGSNYLPNSRVAPLSPYEVKAGTVIPSVMISGINSDIPGQLIGQVCENVFDTARGEYLLIPQGSRLVGSYDSGVSSGQKRILVVWRRIIYPDGSSVDLETMPAADQEGYAGMHDQVDNHYLRAFGSAILLSVFSATSQLSQPNTDSSSNSDGTTNNNSKVNIAQQTAAAALGQQLSQLGTQMIQKNMDVAPTLIVRPGYKFIIMVNKDMQLTPWKH